MSTKTKSKISVTTIAIAAAGLAIVAGIALITFNPKLQRYFTPTFRPYRILPGYVTPGYTPGYRAPGYAPGYRR